MTVAESEALIRQAGRAQEATALLARLIVPGATFVYVAEEGIICGLCDAQAWREEEMVHKPGCLVLDTAAFLADAASGSAPPPG